MNENIYEYTTMDCVKAAAVVAGLTFVACGGAYAGAILAIKGCGIIIDAYDKIKAK